MRRFVAFLAGLAFLGSAATAAPPIQPRLVIVISVDQFSSAVYRRYAPEFTGGLKRLSSGIAFPIGYQSHAMTETCPGHSTILTGDHPSRTGIVGNGWFERSTGSSIYCVAVPGNEKERGPQRLRVTTLGDWMKAAFPGSRVISVSGKDRAAIMLGGHFADLEAWWSNSGFTTSPFAGRPDVSAVAQLPAWSAALKARWQANPPALWPTNIPDRCKKLERPFTFGKIRLSGRVPPDESLGLTNEPGFFDRSDFQSQLRSSPLYDSIVLDLAAELARNYQLGSRSTPDLLAISLSATDYVGHRFGPGGAEMCAQVNALDTSLAAFFAKIDALGVPYVVALTADHGSTDAAERARADGVNAERLDSTAFVAALNAHLRQVLALDHDPIVADDPQVIYLNAPGDAAFQARLRDETIKWLRQQPSVVAVLTAAEVAAAAPKRKIAAPDLTLAERLSENFDPQRSGDIMVEFREHESFWVPEKTGESIAGHGSPWDHDRQVPILFWWPGAPSDQRTDPAETVDIAPTLSAILGISPPDVDGQCLEAVASCPSATAN